MAPRNSNMLLLVYLVTCFRASANRWWSGVAGTKLLRQTVAGEALSFSREELRT